jgi:drug efflux transport system permease protein
MTPRFWSLVLKELRQIRRDKRLVLSLIIPPVVQLLVFGLALDPEVKDLRVGIVDESRTAESRELVSAITENRTLRLHGAYPRRRSSSAPSATVASISASWCPTSSPASSAAARRRTCKS